MGQIEGQVIELPIDRTSQLWGQTIGQTIGLPTDYILADLKTLYTKYQ